MQVNESLPEGEKGGRGVSKPEYLEKNPTANLKVSAEDTLKAPHRPITTFLTTLWFEMVLIYFCKSNQGQIQYFAKRPHSLELFVRW